jgi:outer membrane protein TolC
MSPQPTRATLLKIRQAIGILAITTIPAIAGAQTLPYTPLPEDCFPQLREILSGVDETSPRIQQESENISQNEAYLKDARSNRGLKVSGYGRLQGMWENRFNSDVESDNKYNFGPYAGINAGVPIFHWGEIDARIAQAKSRIGMSKSQKKQRISEVRQEIRRNYVEYELSALAAKIARDNIDYARKRHMAMEGLVERGMLSPQNVADADIYEQERDEDLAYAENQAQESASMIGQLSGKNLPELAATDIPDIPMLSADELDKLGKAATDAYIPPIEALDNELAAEQAGARELKSRNRPKIDAVVSTNMDYTDEYRRDGRYEPVPRLYSWAGVQANWTIYDNGSMDAQGLACLARQRAIRARIRDAQLNQTREVSNIVRDAQLNKSRYETRLRKLDLLKKTVSMMESQLERSSVSTNDLFQRKQELERTRLDLYRASAAYMLDVAQLRELASFGPKK